jgi:hypothetical protein
MLDFGEFVGLYDTDGLSEAIKMLNLMDFKVSSEGYIFYNDFLFAVLKLRYFKRD